MITKPTSKFEVRVSQSAPPFVPARRRAICEVKGASSAVRVSLSCMPPLEPLANSCGNS